MSETKTVTLAELQEHKDRSNLYILISGKVYNASKFLDEHPGGDEVILSEAGRDATEAFEDVGHSDEARALLPAMFVGDFEGGLPTSSRSTHSSTTAAAQSGSNAAYLIPLALVGAYFAYRFYSSGGF